MRVDELLAGDTFAMGGVVRTVARMEHHDDDTVSVRYVPRPTCSTCKGTGALCVENCRCDPEAFKREGPHDHSYPCTDCVDGLSHISSATVIDGVVC